MCTDMFHKYCRQKSGPSSDGMVVTVSLVNEILHFNTYYALKLPNFSEKNCEQLLQESSAHVFQEKNVSTPDFTLYCLNIGTPKNQ